MKRKLALLATLVYTLSLSAVEVTKYGNGDHTALQHLTTVAAVLGCLAVTRDGRRVHQAVTGLGLGLAVWVSTEAMVVIAALVNLAGVALIIVIVWWFWLSEEH